MGEKLSLSINLVFHSKNLVHREKLCLSAINLVFRPINRVFRNKLSFSLEKQSFSVGKLSSSAKNSVYRLYYWAYEYEFTMKRYLWDTAAYITDAI